MRLVFEDDIDIDDYSDDSDYDETVAHEFEKAIRNLLYDILSNTEDLNEQFTSDGNMNKHYLKHCIGNDRNKISTRHNVFYDFNDRSKYCQYEKSITDKINNSSNNVGSLYDYETIMKYIRKLFEGDFVIRLCNSCGLNNNGVINMSFISFSSHVTRNYSGGNTIDICVKNALGKTITLYPVDSSYLQNKFNNIIRTFGQYSGSDFEFNH